MREKRIRALIAMLAALCVCGTARGEETWYMRVIARDDTALGQTEKERVRDAALSALPRRAADIPACLGQIARAANRIAPCTAEIRLWSPDENTPAAPSVYLTVGSGQGHNWWGILYEDALALARADAEETQGDAPVFLWPLWEKLMRWLGL